MNGIGAQWPNLTDWLDEEGHETEVAGELMLLPADWVGTSRASDHEQSSDDAGDLAADDLPPEVPLKLANDRPGETISNPGGQLTTLPLAAISNGLADKASDTARQVLGDRIQFPSAAADPDAAVLSATTGGTVAVAAAPCAPLYVVSTLKDELDGDYSAGDLSLREAINLAPDGSRIEFDPDLQGQIMSLVMGRLLLLTDLVIDGDMDGDDKADITISGADTSSIFRLNGSNTEFHSLTLTNASGSAIYTGGNSIHLINSTIKNSQTTGLGAAISSGGNVYVINSLLTNNFAGSSGGAISVSGSDTLTLVNSTVSGNSSNNRGGALHVSATALNIYNSTIVNNHAHADDVYVSGGGIFKVSNATANLYNSVIANNTSGTSFTANDFDGNIDAAAYSFIGTYETLLNDIGGNTNGGGDSELGALADNGGTVLTHAPIADSPLINAGDHSFTPDDDFDLDNDGETTESLPTDATGNVRVNGSALDIGAVEFQHVVTTLDDVVDANDGELSLREAIALGPGTITFDPVLRFTGTLALTGGQLTIADNITINGDVTGDGKADITIDGDAASRIFQISGAGTYATVRSLTLTNGSAAFSTGGAIAIDAGTTFNLINSTVQNSFATFGGGGIVSYGVLYVVGSTISGNRLSYSGLDYAGGGGILINSSNASTFINTTIADNTTYTSAGGGLLASSNAILTFVNSTIAGNTSGSGGGGIELYSAITANFYNSVVALNGASDINETGAASTIRAGNSFFGTSAGIDIDIGGNIDAGGDPLLATLADNGGPVQTRAIIAGSPLIGAGYFGFLRVDRFDLDDDGDTTELIPLDAKGSPRQIQGLDIGASEFVTDLVVDTLVDENDGDYSAGDLSLREAVALVADGGNITFDSGLAGGTIVLNGSHLELINGVTIDGDTNGDDIADITISGGATSRLFFIDSNARTFSLTSLNLIDGNAGASRGGAISIIDGHLSVINSAITGNSAHTGGGIYVEGADSLNIVNSLISGNTATIFAGGGIYSYSTSLSLTNSTLHNNTANGIYGGGIATVYSTLTLNNSTITDNQVSGTGGGLSIYGSTTRIYNSAIAGNTGGSGSVPDDLRADGYFPPTIHVYNSFFSVDETADFTTNLSNIIGADPMLGQLLDNGGTVLTRSPLDGSPLIDAGDNSLLPMDDFDIDGDMDIAEDLPIDGRGATRILGGTVDIGAVEQFDDETIGGTEGDDLIIGGNGTDSLSGRAGNDTLIGGAEGDTLDGGDDTDTVSYETASTGVRAVLQNPATNTGDAAGDSYVDVENLTGSDHADQLIGDTNDNTIAGRAGRDRLVGRDGNDSLFGGGDNDRLEGGLGADVLNGGSGQDRVQYGLAAAAVLVDLDNAAVNTGEAAGDSFASIENILGSKFDDTLRGDAGDNKLLGNARNDSLSGRGGNDLLIGGGGVDELFGGAGTDRLDGGIRNDIMTGGADADTFVFAANSNTDRILDFADNVDRLELNDNLWTNTLTAADVVNMFAVQAGANVRFDFAGGERLIVENFTLADITDDIDIV